MSYHVTASALTGRQKHSFSSVPLVADCLRGYGWQGTPDELRKALADRGEWRGMTEHGGQTFTVLVTVDHFG